MLPIILASTSAGRRELLRRLGLPFEVCPPSYREEGDGRAVPLLARRHAVGKAVSVARARPERIVIGSDQVASLDGEVLGKPGTPEGAREQLTRMAGRWTDFYTGLAVLRGERQIVSVDRFRVRLQQLTAAEIAAYVERERPLECAGSFRVEGLGIALMAELEGRDYTSLIGLPLIALCEALRQFGVDPLAVPVQDP